MYLLLKYLCDRTVIFFSIIAAARNLSMVLLNIDDVWRVSEWSTSKPLP